MLYGEVGLEYRGRVGRGTCRYSPKKKMGPMLMLQNAMAVVGSLIFLRDPSGYV
jgi:hypothetical protein